MHSVLQWSNRFNQTEFNSQEYPGLIVLTIVTLKVLLPTTLNWRTQEKIIRLFWCLLLLNDMNLPENTTSFLDLDKWIMEFLVLYKDVLGPITRLSPKVVFTKSNSMPPCMQPFIYAIMALPRTF